MEAAILYQLMVQLVLPVAVTGGTILFGWLGKGLGTLIRQKTNNEEAALAVEKFTLALTGAVAETEQLRLNLPQTLTQDQQNNLKKIAIDRAGRVVGESVMKILSKNFGSVTDLATGIVEETVSYTTTNTAKIKASK